MKPNDIGLIWVLTTSISLIIFSGRAGESFKNYLEWCNKKFPGSVHADVTPLNQAKSDCGSEC